MLASEIKVCRPRAGGEPGAMLASEKQERSSLNETQSGWIAPSSAREWIDRSGARCMEIPEQCSRVDKQERCSLCGNPEIYSRMETVERSSQVGRVERGREGRKKRVVQQKAQGGKAGQNGSHNRKHGASEPQEERGDDGETNSKSGADGGAGGD